MPVSAGDVFTESQMYFPSSGIIINHGCTSWHGLLFCRCWSCRGLNHLPGVAYQHASETKRGQRTAPRSRPPWMIPTDTVLFVSLIFPEVPVHVVDNSFICVWVGLQASYRHILNPAFADTCLRSRKQIYTEMRLWVEEV